MKAKLFKKPKSESAYKTLRKKEKALPSLKEHLKNRHLPEFTEKFYAK